VDGVVVVAAEPLLRHRRRQLDADSKVPE